MRGHRPSPSLSARHKRTHKTVLDRAARMRAPLLSCKPVLHLVLTDNSSEISFTSSASIHFYAQSAIESIFPWNGPTRGGTVVTISGSELPLVLASRCFFGSIATLPRLQTKSSYECVSPAATASRVVEVSINHHATTAPFFYYTEAVITSVRPSKGPVLGGSHIEVSGLHFSISETNSTTWCGRTQWYVPRTSTDMSR